jgi:hypothetical protein
MIVYIILPVIYDTPSHGHESVRLALAGSDFQVRISGGLGVTVSESGLRLRAARPPPPAR